MRLECSNAASADQDPRLRAEGHGLLLLADKSLTGSVSLTLTIVHFLPAYTHREYTNKHSHSHGKANYAQDL